MWTFCPRRWLTKYVRTHKYTTTKFRYIFTFLNVWRISFYTCDGIHHNRLFFKLRQWPTWCSLALFYNKSTTILYMFLTLTRTCYHQEDEQYWCNIWYGPVSQWPSRAQVEIEPVSSQPVHRTATDWEDDTRCCINTVQPPDDKRIMLETCRGF